MAPPDQNKAPVPGPHNPPPDNFAQRELALRIVDHALYRFHSVQHQALHWGLDPPRRFPFRFDAPELKFGVMYTAADVHAAFVETFLHDTTFRQISPVDL